MQHSQAYYKALLSGFIRGNIDPEQVEELYAFIRQSPEAYRYLMNDPDITRLVEEQAGTLPVEMLPQSDARIREALNAYAGGHAAQEEDKAVPAPVLSVTKGLRKWWWAAAVVVVGMVTAVVLSSRRQQPVPAGIMALAKDVAAPQSNRATITLAGGQKVYLDSALNGQLAMQGSVRLVKLADGRLAYQNAEGKAAEEVPDNTLFNPRGSRVIDILLSDGSRVWLDAGSSLTYPVAFTGNERKVTVTGEAYFEVAHNAAKPFYVSGGNVQVKVLGTHFNVNAYDDEKDIRVTLLEGSVAVKNSVQSTIIKPGQQAVVTGSALTTRQADTEAVMAWKNGLFDFNRQSLQEVMRQLSRWYDIDVAYQGEIATRKFGGQVQRDLNLSEVLAGLKAIGIRYTIEGRKLVITE